MIELDMFPLVGTKRKRDHDESDSEDDMLPGKQILPVANLPADFDGEPMDGAQYLFTVRRDARKLPDITRVQNPYIAEESSQARSANAPGKAIPLPTSEWRDVFGQRFKHLRHNLSRPTIRVHIPSSDMMPPKKERDLWWAFLAGRPEADWKPVRAQKQSKSNLMRGFSPEPDPAEEHQESCEQVWKINDNGEVELAIPAASLIPQPAISSPLQSATNSTLRLSQSPSGYAPREPTSSFVNQIDHKTALHLLMYFTHWINLHLRQPQVSTQASPSGLSESHARWMLSLLTRVDDYVSADEMHLLRNLARACVDVVKELREVTRSQETSQSRPMSERSCWMVFTLVADHWAQRDLWMDAETTLAGV